MALSPQDQTRYRGGHAEAVSRVVEIRERGSEVGVNRLATQPHRYLDAGAVPHQGQPLVGIGRQRILNLHRQQLRMLAAAQPPLDLGGHLEDAGDAATALVPGHPGREPDMRHQRALVGRYHRP